MLAVDRARLPGLVEQLMPDEHRRAQRAAGVSGRGLDPDVVEWTLAKQPAVGDAVERHAAREHQPRQARLAEQVPADREHSVFGHRLDARRQVHVPLLEVRFGLPRRSTEKLVERPVRHRQPLAVVEVVHVQPEAAVVPQLEQMTRDQILVERPAVRRESHQFVFAAVHLEAAVIRERRIQKTERVRELDVTVQLDPVAAADAERGRAPLADAVERQDRRFLERTRKKGAGGVALVMVGEHDRRAQARDRCPSG